jgi:hypothetical protein
MRKVMMVTAAISMFLIVPSYAQDDDSGECQQLADGVYSCPLPRKPAPPPTCHVFGENLICTAPVVISSPPEKKSPTNCGWSRKANKYVCW